MPDASSASSRPEAPRLKSLAGEKAGALHPKDTVETAGDRMRQLDAPAWPVAEDRKLVGMIDVKNPDWKSAGHGHDPRTSHVGDMMTRQIVFCHEDATCDEARRVMDENGIKHLPVVDREMKIVGIFSREEVAGANVALVAEPARTPRQEKADEATAAETDPSAAD